MAEPVIIVEDQPPLPGGQPSTRMDDLAYVLPMAIFMLLTWLGSLGGEGAPYYPASYIAKTLLVPVALVVLWKRYTRISWDYWWLGIIVGVAGIVQWVGMEKLLLWLWPNYPRPGGSVYDPTKHFGSAATLWSFIAIRWAGATLVVPFMEELFWRDFLWRNVSYPNDFKRVPVGGRDWRALLVVSGLFCTVHVQWLTAIVWGLLIGWLLIRTRSLGACIIAHGVTNFLLGLYVLVTKDWQFW